MTKHYKGYSGDGFVLQNVSLTLDKGEFLAIRGPSGSGKTSLLRLIAGIDLPDSGSICVKGQQISSMTEPRRAKIRKETLGFAFQFFELIDELDVLENIVLPRLIFGGSRELAHQEALKLMHRFSISHLQDQKVKYISGGEKQRVSLARALINNPQLLLADEPTASLGTVDAEQALSLLKELQEDSSLSIILVTHSVQSAAYADRVLRFPLSNSKSVGINRVRYA